MKKLILAGIIVLIAMFAVTCDEGLDADDVEYTDVVYSPDGSQVTIYLDGVKVPVTKAQRAVSRDLATMAYDFLEVIFIDGSYVARNSWELGYPAGISGVHRTLGGVAGAGAVPYGTLAQACLFAGKKDGKTLFGIGQLTSADTGGTSVSPTTNTVTFSIRAIQTGLTVLDGSPGAGANESTPGPSHPRGVVFSSLQFGPTAGTGAGATGYTSNTTTNTELVTHGGIQYPLYKLPTTGQSTVNMQYTFSVVGGNTTYISFLQAAKYVTASPPFAQRRTPRYMEKGAYREPKSLVNTRTKVEIASSYVSTATGTGTVAFDPVVPLVLTSPATANGILSFYLEIPVYMVNNAAPDNTDGKTFTTWKIRTGYGSELYSLDDGVSNGGCALIGLGVDGTGDWLNIDWEWVK